jgi:predicted flap endonuclease-1-like 5' DNA nuclease
MDTGTPAEPQSTSSVAKEMPAPLAPSAAMQTPAFEQPQAEMLDGDPLIGISGIGPSTQDRLYAAGIKTFAQLADADPDTLREIAGAAVTRRYNVQDWIEEARQRRSE